MISFEQQVIAITGAGNGIGLATAALMAAHGARLALTDIDGARLAQVAAELDPGGERVRAYALDVSSSADCDRALAQAAQDFGGLDHGALRRHLSGKPGARHHRPGLEKADGREPDGTFYVCRAAERHLRENGSIVLLTSLAAQRGSYAHAAYSASKGAVQSFTRSLALELAPGARERGRARHHRHLHDQRPYRPEGRPAAGQHAAAPLRLAEEIAGPIAFLCSPLAAFVTGEVMQVNGASISRKVQCGGARHPGKPYTFRRRPPQQNVETFL